MPAMTVLVTRSEDGEGVVGHVLSPGFCEANTAQINKNTNVLSTQG
jgi:hypothetical protein